jgi:hypothetical protein
MTLRNLNVADNTTRSINTQLVRVASITKNLTNDGRLPLSAVDALPKWNPWTPTRTASAGTWTVGTVSCSYRRDGDNLRGRLLIDSSSVSNAAVTLVVTLPAGCISAKTDNFPLRVKDNGGAWVWAYGEVSEGGTSITIYATVASGTFGISATATSVRGSFEIQVYE